MKKLISIFALIFTIATINVNAQTLVRPRQAAAADTLHKSTTSYSATNGTNVNFSTTQYLNVQVEIDTTNGGSGTPTGNAIFQWSVDGQHWITDIGDTTAFASANAINISWSKNAFKGAYCRVAIVTSSATQFSHWWCAIKSANMY